MNKTLRWLRDHGVQVVALAVLVVCMLSAGKRSALPALGALAKFVWPFLAVWLIWKVLAARVGRAVDQLKEQLLQGMPQPGSANQTSRSSQVIDLCSQCGSMLTPGHRCSGKKKL